MPEQYPSSLPLPKITPYKMLEQEHFRRNDVQSGPPRYEFLTDVKPNLFSVAFSFNAFEFQVFEGWFKTSLTFGSQSFFIDLDVGMGLVPHECYLDKSYNPVKHGKRWLINAGLLAVEKEYNTDADACDVVILSGLPEAKDPIAFFELLGISVHTYLASWDVDYQLLSQLFGVGEVESSTNLFQKFIYEDLATWEDL